MAKKKNSENVSSEVETKLFLGTITIGEKTFQIFDDVETSAREFIEIEE